MEYVKGLLSICCCCYNHEEFIEDCIKSIWNCDYKNVEFIVLDDGSKDESVRKLTELKEISPCPMEIITQENTHNIGYNFNRTIQKARGEYITFMSADDMYTKDAFAKKIEMLNADENLYIVASNIQKELKKGTISYRIHDKLGPDNSIDEVSDIAYKEGAFGLQGNVFRRELVDIVNGFDEDISGDDIIITTKMIQYLQKNRNWKLKIVDFPSIIYRLHENNFSGKSINTIQIYLDCYDRYWSDREYTQSIINLIYTCLCENPIEPVLSILNKHPRAFNLVMKDSMFYVPMMYSLKRQYVTKKKFWEYICRIEPKADKKYTLYIFNKMKITVNLKKMFKYKIQIIKLFNKNVKFYDHYISLGYNCEMAYRFFKKYGFVESSLFTWTFQCKVEDLIFALQNINLIYTEKPVPSGTMWKCTKTNIHFHGTEPYEMRLNFDKYSDADFEPYQKELVSRINHLKEKFKSQITDEKKTLLAYTYMSNGENTSIIAENILKIKSALDNIGANNYDFLVVLEQKNDLTNEMKKFDGKNIFIRYVNEFAPAGDVTTKHYDKKSWSKILNEFRPNFRQKKTKKFKFEQV